MCVYVDVCASVYMCVCVWELKPTLRRSTAEARNAHFLKPIFLKGSDSGFWLLGNIMQDVCDFSPGAICPQLYKTCSVRSQHGSAGRWEGRRGKKKITRQTLEGAWWLKYCVRLQGQTPCLDFYLHNQWPLLPNQGTLPSGIFCRPALLLTTPLSTLSVLHEWPRSPEWGVCSTWVFFYMCYFPKFSRGIGLGFWGVFR